MVKIISYDKLLEDVIIRPNLGTLEYKGLNKSGCRVRIYKGRIIDEIVEDMKRNEYTITCMEGN